MAKAKAVAPKQLTVAEQIDEQRAALALAKAKLHNVDDLSDPSYYRYRVASVAYRTDDLFDIDRTQPDWSPWLAAYYRTVDATMEAKEHLTASLKSEAKRATEMLDRLSKNFYPGSGWSSDAQELLACYMAAIEREKTALHFALKRGMPKSEVPPQAVSYVAPDAQHA